MMIVTVFIVPVLICLVTALFATRCIIRRYSVEQQPLGPLRFIAECLLVLTIVVAAMLASGIILGWTMMQTFSGR